VENGLNEAEERGKETHQEGGAQSHIRQNLYAPMPFK